MNIVILGHVCIDKNTSEHVSYTAPGSPAIFLSKIFNQLPDSSTTIISSYGTDFLPYTAKVSLYPKEPNAKHTLIYENVTKNKKRTQKALFSEDAQPVVIDENVVRILKQADILYIAPITPNFSADYIKKVVGSITKNCIVIFSPQGYFRQFDADDTVIVREFTEADDILPLVDFVITSEQDHPHMNEVAEEWAKKFDITVVITKGEQGADVFTKGNLTPIPTSAIAENDIVDSVGSGDIFSAGFGYWYKKTGNVSNAVTFANKLAGACLFFSSEDIRIDYDTLIEKMPLSKKKFNHS